MNARRGPASRQLPPSKQGRSVSQARSAAFEILRRVEDEGAYASVLLAAIDEDLRPDDRALCYELVMGISRWQLWLDALIDHYAARKAEMLDKPVRRALRMGLYELRFLTRIPNSATVNEAVNLVHLAHLRSASGLVNAVLRRATRETDYDPSAGIADPLHRVSIATSHPLWLIERWMNAIGIEETERFACANNEVPPIAFRLTSKDVDADKLLRTLLNSGAVVYPSRVAPQAWRVEGATSMVRSNANEGMIYLQDEASQLVGHVIETQSGDSVLDVCAAPGSKTTHIAALAPDAGLIVAGDLYSHRLRTVRETSSRMGLLNMSVLVHDADAALPFREESFDRVLVDAPCSGTGTLRRNPEIRWRISPEDIKSLAARQKRILSNSAAVVRRGGRLVYATCSIEKDENEDVIDAFLREHKDFVPVAVRAAPLLQCPDGTLRTWPQRDGVDGFFIAVMERCN